MAALSACGRAPLEPMRVAADIWVGNEMLAVAEHAGRLDPSEIRRVEFSSNQEILRALRNGLIESAALMIDEAMVAAHDGADLVILAAVDCSIGSDAVIGTPGLGTMAALKGRRVGVQLNSAGLQILYRGLAQSGMSASDVSVVNVPPDRHVRTFSSGDVDAVVTYDPMRTIVLSRGGVELFSSKSIPGDIVNVLVARRDYVAAHPERARALMTAWFDGGSEFRRSPEARAWVAHRQGLTVAQLDSAMTTVDVYDAPRSRALIAGEAAPLVQVAQRFHYFMRQNGRLTRDIAVQRLFDSPPDAAR